MKYSNLLESITRLTAKPPIFEPGELHFWDDPHISIGLLEAHLNPENDAASRRPVTIEKEIENLIAAGVFKPGDRVLDLGCGPGLYTVRLAERGMKVTGIDFSERSLNYAIAQSKEKGLDIDYRLMNFFDIDFNEEFDAVLQSYGELSVFPDDKRDELLAKLHRALKPGGMLAFDVSTRAQRTAGEQSHGWYVVDGGFWRAGRHMVLEQTFDYPDDDVWLDQYVIIDEEKVSVYRTWFHDYSLPTLRQALMAAGFKVIHAWNDLSGTPYEDGGEWLAVAAQKSAIRPATYPDFNRVTAG